MTQSQWLMPVWLIFQMRMTRDSSLYVGRYRQWRLTWRNVNWWPLKSVCSLPIPSQYILKPVPWYWHPLNFLVLPCHDHTKQAHFYWASPLHSQYFPTLAQLSTTQLRSAQVQIDHLVNDSELTALSLQLQWSLGQRNSKTSSKVIYVVPLYQLGYHGMQLLIFNFDISWENGFQVHRYLIAADWQDPS